MGIKTLTAALGALWPKQFSNHLTVKQVTDHPAHTAEIRLVLVTFHIFHSILVTQWHSSRSYQHFQLLTAPSSLLGPISVTQCTLVLQGH